MTGISYHLRKAKLLIAWMGEVGSRENEANLHSRLRVMLLKLPASTSHRGLSPGGGEEWRCSSFSAGGVD